MSGTTLELRRVSKTFPGGIRALDNVSLTVRPGEFVVIVGASGAGKSTLLRTINGLVRPDSGQVLVGGRDISALRGKELRRLRRGHRPDFPGFQPGGAGCGADQRPYRAPGLPAGLADGAGHLSPADVAMARQALDRLGLADKTFAKAAELSGGQKQRVSIARALVQQPHTILADEPVASLDPPTARDILGWFRRINEQEGITVIVNLHDIGLAAEFGGRLVGMREGKIVHDGPASQVDKQTFARIYRRSLEEIGHAAD